MADLAYLIALFPLASAIVIFFFGRWIGMKGAWLGILAMAASWILSADLMWRFLDGSLSVPHVRSVTWFEVGLFRFEWGTLLDGPSLVMLMVVTTVSLLVQVYSLGYMHDAPRFKLFYAYLSLFTSSMLVLVLANNFLQFFIGWEVMGACSYLLISFEYERPSAGLAGDKAFLTTRLGDLGLYLGLLLTFYVLGTFNFDQIRLHLADGHVTPVLAQTIALLFFCGAVGKSAQVPLHVWLPDAMEGPTPVSALIHAATMVAAGVYLIARTYGFFMLAPQALEVVAWVGGITAVFAATIAVTANDIKKVLAYSTISQLGYMVMGLGVLGYAAGLFHLTTHAAFKALLFLAAGSVIHAVHTNDLWKMGSLSKQLLTTTVTFFCGTLALVGFPGTAGFFSKESILGAAYGSHHHALFAIGCLGAFLTSFYMARAFCLAFLGEPRERDRFAHAHESPWSMAAPLMVMAALALALGWLMHGDLERFFPYEGIPEVHESHWAEGIAIGSSLLGLVLGFPLYAKGFHIAVALARVFSPVHRLWSNKYYVDELYDAVIVGPTVRLSRGLAWIDDRLIDRIFVDGFGWMGQGASRLYGWFDDWFVDGFINAAGATAERFGAVARRLQNGSVQQYLLIISVGFLFLALFIDSLAR